MISDGPSLYIHRAVPWTALLGALVVLMVGVAMALYEEHLYQARRLREAEEDAQILAASETAALSFNNRDAAAEYVRRLRVNSEIEAIAVYANDGRPIASFVRQGKPAVPERISAPHAPVLVRDAVIVIVPVVQDAITLGFVYLRSSAEPPDIRLVRESISALMVLTALVVIVGLGTAQARLQRQADRLEDANARLQTEMFERAKAEEALRQSQKMEAIGQLSGAIAHDFNNLLMIVQGNLHLLQRKLSLSSDDRHLHAALEGIKRAAALTQRILAFSRKQNLSPALIQLSELVAGMDVLIRNSLSEDIEIVLNLRARWWVVVDRNQMENVILNLVINARDAMPNGGKLYLTTEDAEIESHRAEGRDVPAGNYVTISVRDTGVGMSDEVRSRSLDPFFTTKPSGQGTGLGLSTTFGFISQSGGYMCIDSAPGRGTTIAIFLPRTAVARAAKSAAVS